MSALGELHVLEGLPGVPRPEMVAMLEDLVEQARRGELQAVTMGLLYANGNFGTAVSLPAGGNVVSMLGALRMVEQRVLSMVEEP